MEPIFLRIEVEIVLKMLFNIRSKLTDPWLSKKSQYTLNRLDCPLYYSIVDSYLDILGTSSKSYSGAPYSNQQTVSTQTTNSDYHQVAWYTELYDLGIFKLILYTQMALECLWSKMYWNWITNLSYIVYIFLCFS